MNCTTSMTEMCYMALVNNMFRNLTRGAQQDH